MVRFERGCDPSSKRSIKSFKALFSFMVVYICLWLLWESLKNTTCFTLRFIVYCCCHSYLLCGHGLMAPLLLLFFLSWLSLHSAITIVGASFVVMISWHHRCCCWCFFRGHGHLVPLLMVLVLLSWSWSPNAIAIGVSFVIMVARCHYCCCCFLCGHGHLVPSLMLLFSSWSWSFGTIILTISVVVVVT